jgi:hypothetical protein
VVDDVVDDGYTSEEYAMDGESPLVVTPEYSSYRANLPAAYATNPFYDPEKRVLMHSDDGTGGGGTGYYTPRPVSVFDIKTNPVEYLETRLPLPTISSPVREMGRRQNSSYVEPLFGARAGEMGVTSPGGVFVADAVLQDELSALGESGEGGVLVDAVVPIDGNVPYCSLNIPSKELRQVREDLGAEMADYTRWGRGAGGGVSLQQSTTLISGTQWDNGPVAVSSPPVNPRLYDQGFVSMSGVPMIDAGKFRDPLTGVVYSAYESALPPPDADYEETLTAPARNVKLAHLQGGWTDNTPRPTKVELLEDDFHMQYDRSINTYGTYDPSRYVEIFERNNRFTRDDEHPDPDGPELVGVPANMDGNQNVKIRPLPYLPPTNRGKWGETTFRSGVDARVAVGNSEMQVDRTYTTFPKERMESTRQDGGGMQVTGNTQGFMDTQMGGGGRRDIMATQRSVSEDFVPYQAPAAFVRLNSNTGVAQYNAPTGDRGTTLVDGGKYGGQYGATVEGGMLHDAAVGAPTGDRGTTLVDGEYGGQYGATVEGGMLHDAAVGAPTGDRGTTLVDGEYGGQYGATVEGGMLHDAAVEAPTGFAGTSYVQVSQLGGVQPTNEAPAQTDMVPQKNNSLSGMAPRDDNYGSYGGSADSHSLALSQAVSHQTSKSGLTLQRSDYGSFGGQQEGQQLWEQTVSHMISKSGLTARGDKYGSFGGEATAATVQPGVLTAQTGKSGVEVRGDAYGSYGGQAAAAVQPEFLMAYTNKAGLEVRGDAYGSYGGEGYAAQSVPGVYSAQDLTKRETRVEVQAAFDTTFGNGTAPAAVAARSRFSTKKGPLVDFLMPSGSLSGTEGTANGAGNYGQSTSLNSKKEATYNAQYGFSLQVPSDPTVMYGFYNETMEHLNSRPYGNMQHLVAPASYSFFMQQDDD